MRTEKIIRAVILFILLVHAFKTQAGAAAADKFTLKSFLQEVSAANPQIDAAKERWNSARSEKWAALSWPDPKFNLQYEQIPSGMNFGSAGMKKWWFSQVIPFPPKTIVAAQSTGRNADYYRHQYNSMELGILTDAGRTFWAYYESVKTIDITSQNIEILKRIIKIAQSKYESGKAGISNVLKAQTELAKLLNTKTMLEADRDGWKARINMLLSRPMGAEVADPDPAEPSMPARSYGEFEKIALERRPDLLGMRAAAARASSGKAAAWWNLMPDFELGYGVENAAGMAGQRMAMAAVNIPIAWLWRPVADIRKASADKRMAVRELTGMENETRFILRRAWLQATAVKNTLDNYRIAILPQAEQALKAAETNYQSGSTGFLDLLDSQRSLLNFNTEYFQNVALLGEQIVELEQMTGGPISGEGAKTK